jgi:hypothetical protein
LRRIIEVDLLECPGCGAEIRITSFVIEPGVIDPIVAYRAT